MKSANGRAGGAKEEGRGNHLWLERASKGVTGRDERRHRMSHGEKVRKAVTQQNL